MGRYARMTYNYRLQRTVERHHVRAASASANYALAARSVWHHAAAEAGRYIQLKMNWTGERYWPRGQDASFAAPECLSSSRPKRFISAGCCGQVSHHHLWRTRRAKRSTPHRNAPRGRAGGAESISFGRVYKIKALRLRYNYGMQRTVMDKVPSHKRQRAAAAGR